MRRSLLPLCLLFFSFGTMHAQNQLSYSQFGSFGKSANSVFSLLGGSSLELVGRHQWVGMDGAPRGYWMNGHVGLARIGASVGIDVKSYTIGVEANHEITGYFAKGIRISENEYLGLSIGLGIAQMKGDYRGLDPRDIAFGSDVSEFQPTFNIGTGIYSAERYFVGISIPRMVFGSSDRKTWHRQMSLDRVYNVMSVALFDMGGGFHLKPGVLVTYSPVLPLQVDVSSLVFVNRQFGAGIGYRNRDFVSGHLQFRTAGLQVGYAYQFGVGNAPLKRSINNSTHEIALSYAFNGWKGLL